MNIIIKLLHVYTRQKSGEPNSSVNTVKYHAVKVQDDRCGDSALQVRYAYIAMPAVQVQSQCAAPYPPTCYIQPPVLHCHTVAGTPKQVLEFGLCICHAC